MTKRCKSEMNWKIKIDNFTIFSFINSLIKANNDYFNLKEQIREILLFFTFNFDQITF